MAWCVVVAMKMVVLCICKYSRLYDWPRKSHLRALGSLEYLYICSMLLISVFRLTRRCPVGLLPGGLPWWTPFWFGVNRHPDPLSNLGVAFASSTPLWDPTPTSGDQQALVSLVVINFVDPLNRQENAGCLLQKRGGGGQQNNYLNSFLLGSRAGESISQTEWPSEQKPIHQYAHRSMQHRPTSIRPTTRDNNGPNYFITLTSYAHSTPTTTGARQAAGPRSPVPCCAFPISAQLGIGANYM